MIFLTLNDFYPIIQEADLMEILYDDPTLLDKIEPSQLNICQSYTSRTHDSTCLYSYLNDYATSSTYGIGDFIFDGSSLIYECTATASNIALTDTDYFEVNDPRQPIIVKIMVDLCLFEVFSRISPNQIPTLRQDKFDYSMMLLKEFSNGLIGGLGTDCLLTTDSDGDGIVDTDWGCNPKLDQRW